MSLEQLLTEIKQRRLLLVPSRRGRVALWSPNTPVPLPVRRAVSSHSQELQRLIARSDIAVCVNPDLHRHAYSYQCKRYCCDVCARLLPEVSHQK